jgi:geranylgeranyl pyrophosphate synthase
MRASLLDCAYHSIRSEFDRTHEVITPKLRNVGTELQQIDRYLYSVSGKMLRAALALLSGLGVKGTKEHDDELVTLAAVFGLLHGASLVLDDLIDEENQHRHVGAPRRTDGCTMESLRSRSVDPGRPADGARRGR